MARFTQWFWGNYFPGTNLHELNLDWILSEIKRMEDEIDKFESWVVEEIKQEMTEFRAEFTKIQQDFEAQMRKDIDEQFAQKMQEVDEELAQFEQHIDQKLIEFEQQELQPIKIDITNLQDVQGQHTTQLQGLRTDVDSNATAIRKNANDIANIVSFDAYIEQRVDDNHTDILQNTQDITQNSNDIETNRNNIETNRQNIETNTNSITAYKQLIDDNTTAISNLDKKVDEEIVNITNYINTGNDEIENKISENTSSLIAYIDKRDSEYNSSMIAYVEEKIKDVDIDTTSIVAYIDKRDNEYNSSMIAYVEEKIKDIDTTSIVAYVDNSVHNLQEQIDIHTENINNINEELNTVHDIATEALADAQDFKTYVFGSPITLYQGSGGFNITINNGRGFAFPYIYTNISSSLIGQVRAQYPSYLLNLGIDTGSAQTSNGYNIPIIPSTRLYINHEAGGAYQSVLIYMPYVYNSTRTIGDENVSITYHSIDDNNLNIVTDKEYTLDEIFNLIPQEIDLKRNM